MVHSPVLNFPFVMAVLACDFCIAGIFVAPRPSTVALHGFGSGDEQPPLRPIHLNPSRTRALRVCCLAAPTIVRGWPEFFRACPHPEPRTVQCVSEKHHLTRRPCG